MDDDAPTAAVEGDVHAADEGDVHAAGEPPAGAGIVRLDWIATGLFAALATVATVLPEDTARPIAVVHCVLFAVGVVAFLWAFWVAVQRSRTDLVTIGGVYFLTGDTADDASRRSLRWAFAVQLVGAFVAASIRPYTVVAYAVLAPMLGLGLMGLWGARHGRFPPRPAP